MSDESEITKLLRHQLKLCFPDNVYDARVSHFISLVNEAYKHYDSTRNLLERSMDISTKELQQKNEDLQKANETLDDFNHSVSHDLKTHAVNVISLVKMLKKYLGRDDHEKVDDIIHRLEVVGDQFTRVIHGFLEISRFEHLLEPTSEKIVLKSFFEEILTEFSDLLDRKNGKVEIHHSEIEDVFLSKAHLTIILRNLISNGIKYAKTDVPPVVSLKVSQDEEFITIEINDNGIGIDMKKNRHKLFNMFTRLDSHENIEGSGVGLFLVRRLVQRNQGTIEVESELGSGTKMILKFAKRKLK